jgi:ribonuclease HI
MAAISLYTDGACSGNPGPGGYGIVLISGAYRKEMSAGYKFTTNNRMELLAVIVGLQSLKNENQDVTIYSDSKYVIDAIEKKWVFGWFKKGFKDKKNPDLWKQYLNLHKLHNIKTVWVKGHAENVENNRCDELATGAILIKPLLEDIGYLANK